MDSCPKFDERLESSVIGSCLIAPEACEVALQMLKPIDFYKQEYQAAFKAIGELYGSGQAPDEVLLARSLGDSYRDVIGRTIAHCPSAANVESYCEAVRSLALTRALQELSLQIQKGVERNEKPEEIISTFGKEADRMQARLAGKESEPQNVAVLAKSIAGNLGEARQFSGLACGVGDGIVDALVDGWEPSTYTILAARTSMGKSTTALAILRGIYQLNPGAGAPLIISTEMSERALARKDLACAAGLSSRDLKRSNLDMGQKLRIRDAIKNGRLDGVYVASMGGASVEQVRAVARSHKRKHGLPVLLIDLAQQLGSPLKEKDPVAHCSYVSGQLSQLKTELDCAIIACVQINRSVVNEDGKRPGLHNLKGSGSFEEDPDKVLLLHRPSYYGDADKRTEVILAKDRESGETGSCWISYDKSTGRFVDATFRDKK